MNRKGDGNYEIGFGKAPRHARFQKGHSGNPKGRPRGSKNYATLLMEALHEPVVISENGRRKKITKQQAIVKQLVNKATSGDHRSIQLLLAIEARLKSAPSKQLTIVDMLRTLDPIPDGLSEGCRRWYGKLEEPAPAIQRMASANPDPSPANPIPANQQPAQQRPEPNTNQLTDRDLAAIHFANKNKGKPSS